MKIQPGTELGKLLWEYLKSNPTKLNDLAILIGVSAPIIKSLLISDIEPRPITQMKIECFLRKEQAKIQ